MRSLATTRVGERNAERSGLRGKGAEGSSRAGLRELPPMRSTAEGSLCVELAECVAEALVVDAHARSQLLAGQRPWGSGHEIEPAFGKRAAGGASGRVARVWLGVRAVSATRPVASTGGRPPVLEPVRRGARPRAASPRALRAGRARWRSRRGSCHCLAAPGPRSGARPCAGDGRLSPPDRGPAAARAGTRAARPPRPRGSRVM